jgi:hypothetical protein
METRRVALRTGGEDWRRDRGEEADLHGRRGDRGEEVVETPERDGAVGCC